MIGKPVDKGFFVVCFSVCKRRRGAGIQHMTEKLYGYLHKKVRMNENFRKMEKSGRMTQENTSDSQKLSSKRNILKEEDF